MFKMASFVIIAVLCFVAFRVTNVNSSVTTQNVKITSCNMLAMVIEETEPSLRGITNIVDLNQAAPVSDDLEGIVDLSCGGMIIGDGKVKATLFFYHAVTDAGEEEILVEGVEEQEVTEKTI